MTIFRTSIGPYWTLVAGTIAATVASLGMGATAAPVLTPAETALIALGKNVFFDDKLSHPSNKQACASCHDPAWGWTLPNSKINDTTVVAPGAAPHAFGSIKVPTNAYAFFSPPFKQFSSTPPPPFFVGGNFWDGRAEGCGATNGSCPVGQGRTSETIALNDLPGSVQAQYRKYLGPTADQALNPFPNSVEQNIREKNVCQAVKTAKYKELYQQAFLISIDCNTTPKDKPQYHISFKRIAVAVAAWQASPEVNPFSSPRDNALKGNHFPLPAFTPTQNLGHDLFYGVNTSGLNPTRKNARCSGCHNGVPLGETADPANGEAPHELYTDNKYHNIGVPYNREISGVGFGEKVGVSGHFCPTNNPNCTVGPPISLKGMFKTPTLRNVAKAPSGSIKSYSHNGYFKSLAGIVHFYNTRDFQVSPNGDVIPTPRCDQPPISIKDATEAEALAANCWPPSEHPDPAAVVIGNLKLSKDEEAALVAYLETLSDQTTPRAP